MTLHKKSISKLLSFALAATGFVAPMIVGAQPASADTTVKPWSALGKSLDGSKLIAGTWGQGLFISSDSGESWVRVTPETTTATNSSPSTDINSRCYAPFLWTAVAISNDGQTLVGGSWGCGLWVSTDGGSNWRQRSTTISGWNPISNKWKWYSVALSADGSKVYAVNNYTNGIQAGYTNSSAALTQLTWSAGDSSIGSADAALTQLYVTPDGNLFAKNNQMKIYKVIVNLGAGTYGQVLYNPNGVTNFWLGAIDVVNTGDTFTIYAAYGNQGGGKISISRDGGTSWSLLNNAPTKRWLRISASADGQKLIGIASNATDQYLISTTYSHLWISTDAGSTWTSPDSGSTDHHWSEAKVLPDGSFIAVDGQETPLYLINNAYGSSLSWNPIPTVSGQNFTAAPIPHTGNIWRSNTSGGNWVIANPTFFGGPAGRATLSASDTATIIYDPNQTLGQPKLIFTSAAPGATVIVTPTTDPTAGTASPFAVGARILDIAVEGVTGDTQICVDGTSSEQMWHYRSSAWEDITTSHTLTQVCGTTSSFSPFAIGAARSLAQSSSPSSDSSPSASSLREARQREIEKARNEIRNSLASRKTLTADQLLSADFNGVTTKNLELVNADIAKLSEENKQDLQQIEKIVLKYATVDKVAQEKSYSSYDLVSAGLIPQDSKIKTSILSALKKLPGSDLDTYEKIQAVVAKVEKQAADRKERLAAILAKKR